MKFNQERTEKIRKIIKKGKRLTLHEIASELDIEHRPLAIILLQKYLKHLASTGEITLTQIWQIRPGKK